MSATPETGHAPNRHYADQSGELHLNGSLLYFDGPGAGLTALAGGGQAGATPLTEQLNQVTTVATAADSVILPPSVAGTWLIVTNAAAANAMNVFPQVGDTINAGAANAAQSVAAGKTIIFVCPAAGKWYGLLSA